MLTQLFKEQGETKWANKEYTLGVADEIGQRIDIEIILQGKGIGAGKTSYLKSGWIIKSDGTLQMNTPFAGFKRWGEKKIMKQFSKVRLITDKYVEQGAKQFDMGYIIEVYEAGNTKLNLLTPIQELILQ